MTHAQAVEGPESGTGDKRAGIVGRDDRLSWLDARSGIAAGGDRHPIIEVLCSQRYVARRPGRSAGGKDAHNLIRWNSEVRSHRVDVGTTRPDFALFGEGNCSNRVEAANLIRRAQFCVPELDLIEARMRQKIFDLLPVESVVHSNLLLPRQRFHIRLEHVQPPPSPPRTYVTAASPCAAIVKPTGFCCSSAR